MNCTNFVPKLVESGSPFLDNKMEDNKLAISIEWEDKFARSVLNSWKGVSLGLAKKSSKTKVEFGRQPLIWNS